MEGLGLTLKRLRRSRGMTLRELARKAGCSSGYLSLVERDGASPTVSILMRISGALGVPVGAFFSDGPAGELYLVKENERALLISKESGARHELLKAPGNPSPVQPVWVTFEPGAESGRALHSHQGEEFLLLLKGRLRVTVAGNSYELKAGDCLTFPSSLPHSWLNPGTARAEAVWVSVTAGGELEGKRGAAKRL